MEFIPLYLQLVSGTSYLEVLSYLVYSKEYDTGNSIHIKTCTLKKIIIIRHKHTKHNNISDIAKPYSETNKQIMWVERMGYVRTCARKYKYIRKLDMQPKHSWRKIF
jgi:hypothetical protein